MNKSRVILGLILVISVSVLCACGDKKTKTKEINSEVETIEQVEIVKLSNVTLNDDNKVVSITFNDVTYTIPDDVKEEFIDIHEVVYVMKDNRAFHVRGTDVYAEVGVNENINLETLETSSLIEETTELETTAVEQTTIQSETTTKAPETTKVPETTTQKEVVYKDLSSDSRIKKCELELVSRLHNLERWDDAKGDYVPATLYDTVKEKEHNPYLQTLDLGWENICTSGYAILYDAYTEEDDFSVKYPNDSWAAVTERDLQWSKKYLDAIIKDCEAWVTNDAKSSAQAFSDYLNSKYTYEGVNSIFKNCANPDGYENDEYMGFTKEFCEQWCYYDNFDKQYKPSFYQFIDFAVYTYERDGYFDNVNEMIDWISFTGGCENYGGQFDYVRWYYDKNTNKTTVYMVFGS